MILKYCKVAFLLSMVYYEKKSAVSMGSCSKLADTKTS